jgi:multidrug resistance efflux pump
MADDADGHFVECRHIVWNSDGSPVDDGRVPEEAYNLAMADAQDALAEVTRLKSTIEHWRHEVGKKQSQIDRLEADIPLKWLANQDALHAEIDRMKPVVDAAIAWQAETEYNYVKLQDAIRAFEGSQPATSESHEALAGDVAERTCTTCRHSGRMHADKCSIFSQETAIKCRSGNHFYWEHRP